MSLVIFLLALSVLVIIHELGHFIAARLFGVKAEEFGFGFPPRLIGFVKNGKKWKTVGPKDQATYKSTIWSLNWLPLGGFVRIKGETESGLNDTDSIHQKPIWQRVIIISAGVVMNWLLSAVLLTAVFATSTTAYLDQVPAGANIRNRSVVISEVLQNSPASKAGVAPGDVLVSVAGTDVAAAQDARTAIGARGIQTTNIIVKRNGENKTISVTPEMIAELNRPGIGVALDDVGEVSFSFPRAALLGVEMTASMTKGIVVGLGTIVHDLFVSRKVPTDLTGPVGIAVIANQFAKQGIAPFLQFAAMLSVNLAVVNFLPIPALDGGRVLFLILEKIRRRPISRQLEIGIHNVAFLLLILIIVLITVRDVSRFGGAILGGVRGAIGL